MSFQATGGEVPAFSGTLTMPGAITATLPTTVPRDAPLTITWWVSSAERVQVLVAAGPAVVACIVDATDESVVLAPELLGMLSAGPGAVTLSAFNFAGLTAGDYRVLLTAVDTTYSVATLE